MITFAALNIATNLRHAFFTREGGVSEAPYESLNCGFGSGDDGDKVAQNRDIALAMIDLGDMPLLTLQQEHTNKAVIVEEPWDAGRAPQGAAPLGDGMATRRGGVALGILTADCAPVLMADTKAGVIGAAHAGWRGAMEGILEAVVDAMAELGAEPANITAAIGPCIAQRSYEVGDDFRDSFVTEDMENIQYFAPARRAGHRMFDLPGYVARRLRARGLSAITKSPCDTFAEEDRFFSYRRSVLGGEADYGRNLSVIALDN